MNNGHLTGKIAKRNNSTPRALLGLPAWGVKTIYRLAQFSKPGIYPLTLVVGADGRRQLVVEGGKVEELGD